MAFLQHIYYGLLALCLVILIIRHKQLPGYCLWFIPLIAIALIVELIMVSLDATNYIPHRIYQLIEFFLLCLFYNSILRRPRHKIFIRISYVIFLIATLSYYTIYKGSFNIPSYFDFLTEAFFICILVALFFFELLDYVHEINLIKYGAFWLNAVHLIFYGVCFFAMAYYLQVPDTPLGKQMKSIPYYLNLFLYSSYAMIFALVRK